MRHFPLIAALACLACTEPRPADVAPPPVAAPSPGTPAVAAPPAATPPVSAAADSFVMPAPPAGWHVAQDTSEGRRPSPLDMGIGVIELVMDTRDRPVPRVDTLLFRTAPDTGAARAGAWLLALRDGGSWSYEMWAPERLVVNDLEFGYEERGVPFDSVDASGRWHRAILGFGPRGEPWHGWAEVKDSLVRTFTWREKFIEMPLYFLEFEKGDFHASPAGPVVTTARVLADSGFDMEGVEARGEWMKVKVEHPGATCDLPEGLTRRTDYYWIRAFDARGRPRVFYPTRGC